MSAFAEGYRAHLAVIDRVGDASRRRVDVGPEPSMTGENDQKWGLAGP